MGRVRAWVVAVLLCLFISPARAAVDIGLIADPWRTEQLEKKYGTTFHWSAIWLPALAFEGNQPLIDPELLAKLKNQDSTKVTLFYLPPIYQDRKGCVWVIPYADIASGKYDTSLRCLIRQLGAWGRNALLGLFPDANGTSDWMPWGVGCGNTPETYLNAYRHVWTLFAEENVWSVGALWAVNVEYQGSYPLECLYPGDAWVDANRIGGYQWGPNCDRSITSFGDGFGPAYCKVTSLGSPVWTFLETGCANGPWKAPWILGIPEGLKGMPNVLSVLWNEDRSTPEWSFTTNANTISAFFSTKALLAK
jgi:hypothetical protein